MGEMVEYQIIPSKLLLNFSGLISLSNEYEHVMRGYLYTWLLLLQWKQAWSPSLFIALIWLVQLGEDISWRGNALRFRVQEGKTKKETDLTGRGPRCLSFTQRLFFFFAVTWNSKLPCSYKQLISTGLESFKYIMWQCYVRKALSLNHWLRSIDWVHTTWQRNPLDRFIFGISCGCLVCVFSPLVPGYLASPHLLMPVGNLEDNCGHIALLSPF